MNLVSLSTQELVLLELKQALVHKEKTKQSGFILLLGKSGLGKTVLLKRLYEETKRLCEGEREGLYEGERIYKDKERLCKDKERFYEDKEGPCKKAIILFERAFFNEEALIRGLFEGAFKEDKRDKGSFRQVLDKRSYTHKASCVNFLKRTSRTKDDEHKAKTQVSLENFTQQRQKDKNQITQSKIKPQSQITKGLNFKPQSQAKEHNFKPQSQTSKNLNCNQKSQPKKEAYKIYTKHKENNQVQVKHIQAYQIHAKHKENNQVQVKHIQAHQIHTKSNNTKLDFELLYDSLKEENKKIIFLLDELGLYDENLLERIRLLSELSNLCFVLSLDKKQACFLKEHFSSRIIKEIKLKSLNLKEFELYVREKFKLSLKKSLLKSLLKLSRSNLRLVDKILHTFLTLNDFYTKDNKDPSPKRLLQMSLFYHNLLGKR